MLSRNCRSCQAWELRRVARFSLGLAASGCVTRLAMCRSEAMVRGLGGCCSFPFSLARLGTVVCTLANSAAQKQTRSSTAHEHFRG